MAAKPLAVPHDEAVASHEFAAEDLRGEIGAAEAEHNRQQRERAREREHGEQSGPAVEPRGTLPGGSVVASARQTQTNDGTHRAPRMTVVMTTTLPTNLTDQHVHPARFSDHAALRSTASAYGGVT